MGEQKNTVIINGKTYDLGSGSRVDEVVSNKTKVDSSSHIAREHHHLAHHKQQKSITLRRGLKPQTTSNSSVNTAKSIPLGVNEIITAHGEPSIWSKSDRHERARKISKSSAIRRFNINYDPVVSKVHLEVPVQPAPSENRVHHSSVTTSQTKETTHQDFFDQALSQAESHRQTPVKHSHRKHQLAKKLGISPKTVNVLAITLVVIILSSFIVYQNAPNVAMHIAAGQSGLASASLPGYRPSGFTLSSHVAASPGQVVLNFHSNSDDRAFTITQSSSNWSSQTLADSYLSGKQAQLINAPNGKTVYLYGNSNATWVDGGIWYRIEGNSSLSTDQLLKIASSF